MLFTHLNRMSAKVEGEVTRRKLEGFTLALGLNDVRRALHPLERGYSFYFRAHNIHSRIDYPFHNRRFTYLVSGGAILG